MNDTPRFELLAELKGHTDRVWHAAWHPSGKYVATCSSDKTVRFWRPRRTDDFSSEWICFGSIDDVHTRTIRSVAFSPCGRFLACASFDATTSVYQHKSQGRFHEELSDSKEESIDGDPGKMPMSSNGSSQTPEFRLIATLEGHENEVKSVAWSPSGIFLATCSRDKSVWIWEVEEDNEFECSAVLQEHTQDVKRIAWNPVEDSLISCSYDNNLILWREVDDEWTSVQVLKGHSSTVWSLAFHPFGKYFVSCSDDRSIKLWEYARVHEPTSLQWQPPGLIASREGGAHSWHCCCTLSGAHERSIYSIDWCRVSPFYIASGGGDNSICIYKATIVDANTKSSSPADDMVDREDFNCSDDLKDNSLCYDSISLKLRYPNAHLSDVNCVQWHPTAKGILASAGDDEVVKIWQFID